MAGKGIGCLSEAMGALRLGAGAVRDEEAQRVEQMDADPLTALDYSEAVHPIDGHRGVRDDNHEICRNGVSDPCLEPRYARFLILLSENHS